LDYIDIHKTQQQSLMRANDGSSSEPGDRDYLRIPCGGNLATEGAGGDWPGYIGALPPGPAPNDGDWFTRRPSQSISIAATTMARGRSSDTRAALDSHRESRIHLQRRLGDGASAHDTHRYSGYCGVRWHISQNDAAGGDFCNGADLNVAHDFGALQVHPFWVLVSVKVLH
jgi:hypothetical protein